VPCLPRAGVGACRGDGDTIDEPGGGAKLTKPSLARLLSVDDKIELEIEFRCNRTAM
jgi:hypothetical protein